MDAPKLDSGRIADRLRGAAAPVMGGPPDEGAADGDGDGDFSAGERAFAAYKQGDAEAFEAAIMDICNKMNSGGTPAPY